ncbi:MAG: MopE-related protein [Polyangia bacterium]|nr:MopE-related protein [Polyangia bacterium]
MKSSRVSCLAILCLSLWACGDKASNSGDGGIPSDSSNGHDAQLPPTDAAVTSPDGGPCIDIDRDGHCRGADCDDENPSVHPEAVEVCGNGVDDDCDGAVDEGCVSTVSVYYVDRDSLGGACSDSGPGTLTQPFCTIAKANATVAAGDTVFLRQGTYAGETIQPAASGTSNSQRITFAAYLEEEVTMEGSVYCVRLQGNSFITILGVRLYNCERNIYLQGASHNNIGYCEIDTPAGPTTWAGSRVYQGSTYNRFYNNLFSRYGNESYNSGSYQDNGCILDVGNDNEVDPSDHNLIINNTFFHGGHHILGIYANHNIVRGNTFHNEEWYDCNRASIGGLCGNRNVILNSSQPDNNVRNVIEANWIVFSGVPPDQDASAGLSLRTRYNIVRRNIFYHNDSSGVALSNDSGNHNDASNNYIFGNVFFHNGYMLLDDWGPRKNGLMLARWQDTALYNPMTGVAIKNNIFHDNQLHAIYFYYVDEAAQDLASNWEEEGDPLFLSAVGEPAPSDFYAYDFHLQPESPCLDNGSFLTFTANSGEESTLLEVEDAGYFTDGLGLVSGDMIQLEGQSEAVMLTAVDYEANSLTLQSPLSWSAQTGVSLPFLGAGPDQGAYEHAP